MKQSLVLFHFGFFFLLFETISSTFLSHLLVLYKYYSMIYHFLSNWLVWLIFKYIFWNKWWSKLWGLHWTPALWSPDSMWASILVFSFFCLKQSLVLFWVIYLFCINIIPWYIIFFLIDLCGLYLNDRVFYLWLDTCQFFLSLLSV